MRNKNKSKFSKNLEAKLWTLRVIDFLILVLPLIVYLVIGLVDGESLIIQKTALVGSTVVALILTMFNIVFKKRYRSAIWIMIIGIYCACDNIMPLICAIALATVIDEFLITPAINRIYTKYLASITIDERESVAE